MGNATTTAILTKGLTCGLFSACDSIITTHFSLLCDELPLFGGGGGGPYPLDRPAHNRLQPGKVQHFYKPVDDLLLPLDREADYFKTYKNITLRVELKNFHMEKVFRVPEHHAQHIVTVIHLINVTKERVKAVVSALKRLSSKIMVKIEELRRIQ